MIWVACILLILLVLVWRWNPTMPGHQRDLSCCNPAMGQRYPDGSLRPYDPPADLSATDLDWYWANMVLAGVRDGRTGKVVVDDAQIEKMITDAFPFPLGNPYDREKSPVQHGRWLAIAIMDQERRRSLGMDVPDEYR